MEVQLKSINYADVQAALEGLQRGGCVLKYNYRETNFSTAYDKPAGLGRFHLIGISTLWDTEDERWRAPYGFRLVGLPALIALGIEHPDLQKTMVIVATGAKHDKGPPCCIYYPYLSFEDGERVISVPNFGVCWGDNDKKGKESNFYGLFEQLF